MMDGRVGALRAALDAEGFHDVSIMSYTAKYVSMMFMSSYLFHAPYLQSCLNLYGMFLQVCQFILWTIQRSFRFKSKIWR
jgi:hypothetical protein